MTTRRALLLFALLSAFAASPARAGGGPLLVELFTSQGCSSCPPADRFLAELAQRQDLIALSYGVDYWDYLGRKDTFASRENTARQTGYGESLGNRRLYTPQMVVDGRVDAVGSDRAAVEQAIARLHDEQPRRLGVQSAMQRDHVILRFPEMPLDGDATIWLIAYDAANTVSIGRGENRGRQVTYRNVVREIRNLGLYRGMAMELAVDKRDLDRYGRSGCVVVVQMNRHGPVLGTAMPDYESYPDALRLSAQ